jgi:hypothetical protein
VLFNEGKWTPGPPPQEQQNGSDRLLGIGFAGHKNNNQLNGIASSLGFEFVDRRRGFGYRGATGDSLQMMPPLMITAPIRLAEVRMPRGW